MTQQYEPQDELPDALIARLKARDRAVSVLTPAVDHAIGSAAKAQFAPKPAMNGTRLGTRQGSRRWYIPAAAAAAVALVALIVARPFDDSTVGASRLADDVDGSGQVDILDAFALARSRQSNAGAVSQERIDALAARVVSLDSAELVL